MIELTAYAISYKEGTALQELDEEVTVFLNIDYIVYLSEYCDGTLIKLQNGSCIASKLNYHYIKEIILSWKK